MKVLKSSVLALVMASVLTFSVGVFAQEETESTPIDMTGKLGVGVALDLASTTLVKFAPRVSLPYWLSDDLAIVPSLQFNFTKQKDVDANTIVNVSGMALYSLFKGKTTRFNVGGGLGLGFTKLGSADAIIGANIPVYLGVEHFFKEWLSLNVGAGMNLFAFTKQGDNWQMSFDIDTAMFMGGLTIYID